MKTTTFTLLYGVKKMAQGETDFQSILDQSCVLDGVLLSELLGSGSYAKVYKGEWKGIQVAVKQLHDIFSDAGTLQRQGLMSTFYKELGMNIKLRHPNIIQFLGVVYPQHAVTAAQNGVESGTGGRGAREVDDYPMMVMELMHCTLEKRLDEYREARTRMPFSEVIDTAVDIVAALVYLHCKEPRPIAHRDLAPKNVLLSSAGTAKLCDLGVAKWANSSRNNTLGPGTLPYMPPEVRISTHYSPVAVDIYSFGVTLLEMCSGLEPKPKDFAQMTSTDGSCQLVPEKTRRDKSFAALQPNHPLMPIIEQCLQTNADKRPKAKQLLRTLQDMTRSELYLELKQMACNKTCSLCEQKEEELHLLKQQLEEQERELSRLSEENKALQKFRDEHLLLLKFKLQIAAKEGEKYQQQIQEMHDELDEQVQMNHRLEVSRDRTKDFNHLLRQKVEMDSHLNQLSHPLCRGMQKSMSVICVNEQRPKPIPKPRKRKESLPTNTKSTECLDDITDKTSDPACAPAKPGSLYTSSAVSGSVPLLPGLGIDQADDETTMYLQLDAEAMQKAQRKDDSRMNDKKAHPLLKRRSSPGLLDQSAMPQAPPLSHVKDDCSTAEDSLALKKQILKPLLLSPPRTSSYENSDEPIYVKIPPSGPPTPPPRDQDFKFTRGKPCTSSLNSPLSHPKRLSVIDEKDESLKSPYAAGAPGLVRPQGMTQSMKSPRRGEAQTLAPPRPNLSRQGSRGDVLISQVLCNVKAKSAIELTAKKGELVKVTNNALEKKLCIAVKTNGESGTIRKKNIDRIEPVDIPYDSTNPAMKGVISHIAQCSSHNNTWISPVESNQILIIPSSIHSGDVGLLVKMTDYLLCCTDSEEASHFEIDLRERRLLKLSGYVLQCHSNGNNGAPLQWKLEGSHNGSSWNSLSEESGNYFQRKPANYFSVTNPIPCRYFRLTQLGQNSAGNFRFCLSGIELYGQLYSSVIEERFTRRVF